MNIEAIYPKVLLNLQIHRHLRPTVYAEIEQLPMQSYSLSVFGGTTIEKCHRLFMLGREKGIQNKSDLREYAFTTEIWRAHMDDVRKTGLRPSQNKNRIEGLMILTGEAVPPFKSVAAVYDIIRNKQGKATELVPTDFGGETDSTMGIAFVAGWRSRHMSNEEVGLLQPFGMRAFLR